MDIESDLVQQMAKAIQYDIDQTIVDKIVQVEVKKALLKDEELEDWVVNYLADRI